VAAPDPDAVPAPGPDGDELRQNALLAQLPGPEFERLAPLLRVVDTDLRHQVYEPRSLIDAVWFPLTAVFSMVALADDRVVVEVGTVGYEGVLGLPLFLGSPTSPNAAFCQVQGRSAVLAAADLRDFLVQDGDLHRLLHRYTQTTMVQMAQNVVCNSTHSTVQRAARWMLMTADRVRSADFPLTQEFLGQMLGVRRPAVSEAAGRLQADGLIRYSRGRMTVVDRSGLEDVSCSCYGVLRAEFDALERGDAAGPG
jgi:CRP-like cAMP-binding protein